VNLVAAVLGALTGAIVGSFLATLVLRLARGEQAVTGRSRCDQCQRKLKPHELVPLVSRLWLRGHCPACGAVIDPVHWQIELVATVIGAVSISLAPDWPGVALALFGWMLLPLAWLDWRYYWLPDRLVAPLAAAGLLLGGLFGVPLADRLTGGLVGWVALTLLLVGYARLRARDGLGRGDPKLLGAIGLWLGWMPMAPLLALAAGAGLVVALARGLKRTDPIPFGTMLAFAAWPSAVALLHELPRTFN
jgi:leader peptidase (prepilin peptidase) / N-methyltransferase